MRMKDRVGNILEVDAYIRLCTWSGIRTTLYGQVIRIVKQPGNSIIAYVRWLDGSKSSVGYHDKQLLIAEPEELI